MSVNLTALFFKNKMEMRVFTCNKCPKIHVEAGNVLLNFANKQKLADYLAVLESIDAEYYASVNAKKQLEKQIFLPVTGTNIDICFTFVEFNELKKVIKQYLKPTFKFVTTAINTDICLN